jgi:hypothetical protein
MALHSAAGFDVCPKIVVVGQYYEVISKLQSGSEERYILVLSILSKPVTANSNRRDLEIGNQHSSTLDPILSAYEACDNCGREDHAQINHSRSPRKMFEASTSSWQQHHTMIASTIRPPL